MIRLLAEREEDIGRLRARFHVRTLEVFGSGLDETHFDRAESDLDFLVRFEPLRVEEYSDAYFGLLEGLEQLLGRRVDLVMSDAIRNPYFKQAIDRAREVVYAA